MGVGIYYFYHGFGLKAFEGRHIRIVHIYIHKTFMLSYTFNIDTPSFQYSNMYLVNSRLLLIR